MENRIFDAKNTRNGREGCGYVRCFLIKSCPLDKQFNQISVIWNTPNSFFCFSPPQLSSYNLESSFDLLSKKISNLDSIWISEGTPRSSLCDEYIHLNCFRCPSRIINALLYMNSSWILPISKLSLEHDIH